jgi:WhiB family redox-sensing transcriptional regulator
MSFGELCSGLSPDDVGELLGHEILQRPAWHRQAACRGRGTSEFIVERGATGRLAKAVCSTCEVRPACFEAAMLDESLQGVWGNTTASERRILRGYVA